VTGLIGRPILRVEDARLLAGRGHYCDDLVLDGMLHAAILRSDVAHGRLRRIDVTRAMALDGVVDVIAFDEIAPRARPIPIRIGQLPGLERFIQFPLVQDKVRFVGEPIAVVVATSRYLAEDALELIDVDIESLPAVTDWETASAATSLLFENHGTNIASSYRAEAGDVAAAFENADYSRRETFYCHRHTGMPMETRGVVAQWDAAAGRMRVFGAAKIPFPNRRVLAAMLDLPESSIDLIELDVGGGFGVRGEFYPEDFLIPFAARHVGRPVKWIEDRREHLLAANHARDVRCDLEIACRRDGTVLALRGSVFADIGAYARSTGGIPAANAARCLPGPYRIANFQCDVHVFLTNKTPTGTYRGPGMFEANFFSERLLDIAAADLGIDPAEIRRRNLVPAAAMPSARGKLVPYAESETIYDSGDFHSPLNLALAEIGWDKARLAQGRDSDGWYRGVGVACFVASSGVGPKEHARLLLHPDASLELRVGSSTMGQGHETVFAQICAEVLGISPDAIKVLHGSTTLLDNGFGTFHSRAIVMGGSAVFETSKGLIERLRPFAARELGNPNAEMVWRDGAFFAAEGTARVDLGRLAQLATAGGEPLQVDGVGILRVELERSAVKPFSLIERLHHPVPEQENGLCFEHEIHGFGIVASAIRLAGGRPDQRRAQRVGDACGDLILQAGEIRAVAIKSLGPDLGVGLRIDQLSIYANMVVRAVDATLQQIANAEVGADLLGIDKLSFVAERRAATGDCQARNVGRQIGGEIVDDAVSEVILRGIATEIRKRHDRNRQPSARRPGRRRSQQLRGDGAIRRPVSGQAAEQRADPSHGCEHGAGLAQGDAMAGRGGSHTRVQVRPSGRHARIMPSGRGWRHGRHAPGFGAAVSLPG
jgi:aerobic carbon-monoxide dehydrogenase large subunit